MLKFDISRIKIFTGLLILIFIKFNIVDAKILYDKSGILITELELQNYINLQLNSDQIELSKNKAIKQLVLQKKILKDLELNDYHYLNKLDQQINKEFSSEIYENKFIRDFIRFRKIKDEFIIDYYNEKLNLAKFKEIIDSNIEIKLPISDNNCLTIIEFIDLKNNLSLQENLFSNLKNNTNNYSVSIDDKIYQICMNNNYFKELDSIIFNHIEYQIEDIFNDFIYNRNEN